MPVIFNVILTVMFLSFSLATSIANADPNILLGEAIKNASKLNGNLPTKERLSAYENIFGSLDQIVSEFPASDQAIKILSGQNIGNFNPSSLRSKYIKDLTEYYDTVCEASPSYSCLGFVSLKTGNDQCVSAENFADISEAHFNLKNAARVFIGQDENKSFISLAIDSYRNCLKRSKFKSTQFAEDFFSSELLELLLNVQQVSLAKATIENMETPYYKFLGVLDLSAHSDKPFDKAFLDRLRQYIANKIEDKDGNAAMANMALLLDEVRRSSLPIDYGDAYGAVQDYRRWGKYEKTCDPFFAKAAFEMLTTLQGELIGLSKERKKFNEAQAPKVMESYAERPKRMLESCSKDGYYNYYLMTLIHGQLLLEEPKVAAEFKRRAITEYFSERQQLEFFFNHFGKSKAKLASLSEKKGPFPKFQVDKILQQKDSKYFLFTKKVDFGEVCEASKILFKDLKGGKDYDLAIKYMIESPNVDPSTKYKCGDEDLELLLQ